MGLALHIPVEISQDAEGFVARHGLRPALGSMIEHARQTAGLRSIAVSLDFPPEGGDPTVLLLAELRDPGPAGPDMADESLEWRWDRWAIETFPPDVLRHFCMMAIHGVGDDGR